MDKRFKTCIFHTKNDVEKNMKFSNFGVFLIFFILFVLLRPVFQLFLVAQAANLTPNPAPQTKTMLENQGKNKNFKISHFFSHHVLYEKNMF